MHQKEEEELAAKLTRLVGEMANLTKPVEKIVKAASTGLVIGLAGGGLIVWMSYLKDRGRLK